MVPFNPDWTEETVEIDATPRLARDNRTLPTRRVSSHSVARTLMDETG
jgi:hypothetical protein